MQTAAVLPEVLLAAEAGEPQPFPMKELAAEEQQLVPPLSRRQISGLVGSPMGWMMRSEHAWTKGVASACTRTVLVFPCGASIPAISPRSSNTVLFAHFFSSDIWTGGRAHVL